MSLSNLTTNNNNIASLEWEIANALDYGAFAGYDLIGKLVKKAQLQKITKPLLPKVVDYVNFPKPVRAFVKSYFHAELEQFPELISHLGELQVFATERPAHYASDVGAEYFDNANLVASYIPLDQLFTKYAKGLVHEIVHAVQFFLHNRGQKVATPQNKDSRYLSDSKFYLNDVAEVTARNAEDAFEKLSWQSPTESIQWEDFLRVIGPDQVWRVSAHKGRYKDMYLYTGNFKVTNVRKNGIMFREGNWASDIEIVKEISEGFIGVTPGAGLWRLIISSNYIS